MRRNDAECLTITCQLLTKFFNTEVLPKLNTLYKARGPGYRCRGSRFDSRHYQISLEVVGLEQYPLSLVSTTEELHGKNISGSGLQN
jgi:hypothetical protein